MTNIDMKKLDHKFISFVKPTYFLILTFISTTLLWVYVFIPIHNVSNQKLVLSLINSLNSSDQSLCYNNYVWNDGNKHLRFKYILDDNVLEKSKGKNIFFHLTNCFYDGVVEISARYVKND